MGSFAGPAGGHITAIVIVSLTAAAATAAAAIATTTAAATSLLNLWVKTQRHHGRTLPSPKKKMF